MKFLIAVSVALLITFGASAANYVVIGAFANKGNAIQLAKRAKAQVDVNPIKQLFYVFILKTDDHEAALAEALRLQGQTEFKDAWVFSGVLGEGGSGEDIVVSKKEPEIKPQNIEQQNLEPQKVETTGIITPEPVIETPKEETEEELKEEPKSEAKDIALDPKANTKDFYFLVTRESGDKINGAEITAIDPKTQFKQGQFEGNKNVTMKAINNSGDVRFECDLAGYRKIIQTINFKTPVEDDGITIKDNRITIPFQLVRLKKGDHAILYNVFFYKDAALMRPESKFDLDGLLGMMQENDKYKIRIHGHTNGNAAGKILEVGESGNYFTLSGAKEGAGSARKLSEKRADVIKNYLVKNGVSPERMTIKAWGGKNPIYDKHSNQAAANVRVEVEVIEE